MPAPRKKANSRTCDNPVPRHEDCWAKTTENNEPGINVRDHCLNVGCVAEALLERFPDWMKLALKTCSASVLAALHDIGKVSPGFQCKCESWLLGKNIRDRALREGWTACESDHAKISQFTIQQMLDRSQLWDWAAILGAHHGKVKGSQIPWVTEVSQNAWQAERRRLAEELITIFQSLPDHSGEPAQIWFQAGLVAVADWIGSNEGFFPLQSDWGIKERRRHARQALDSIGWKPPRVKSGASFKTLFNEYLPNNLQLAAIQNIQDPGLYVIEGPMGSGKTEAALVAAHQLIEQGKARGIYFALPTQVTSNRIHLRVRQFLEHSLDSPAQFRLTHSTSWLQDASLPLNLVPAGPDTESKENTLESRSWFASSKRALLAPFGVGTVDQALLGIVASNHFFVRQFGLAGKVVILDEVHSYDLYTGTLINVLVKRLREFQSTVIILSATLTEARRRQLLQATEKQSLSGAYPLLSGVNGRQIEIPCKPSSPKLVLIRFMTSEGMIDECIDRAEQGQCVLWIRNTVDEAQETYRLLKSTNCEGGPEIGLLHSRFPFFRREQLEDDWMERLGKDAANRPNGCVLVSTQIAEQSVDIDADLLITDLAPTDMLLQRMGRLWRHDRNRPVGLNPEIWIHSLPLSDDRLLEATERELREALGKSARIYAPYVLLRSYQQWRSREAITLPTDIRNILEATYAEPATVEPDAWRQLHDEIEQQKRKLKDQALFATKIWMQPALPDEEGCQTRFSTYRMAHLLLARVIEQVNAHTFRLHLLEGRPEEASHHSWNFKTAKAIYRNVTPVPLWAVSPGLLRPPGWLANHVSQRTAVGLLRSDGGISWLGSGAETGLSYHGDLGVIINHKLVPRVPEEKFDESYD